MFSRRGGSTIQQYKCFSKDRLNAPPAGSKVRRKQECNPERLTRGIPRDEFRKLQADEEEEEILDGLLDDFEQTETAETGVPMIQKMPSKDQQLRIIMRAMREEQKRKNVKP